MPADRVRVVAALGGNALSPSGGTGSVEEMRSALDCFDEIGTWLGQGLADLAASLDPGVFVIGGGVADAGKLLLEPAQRAYAERLTGTGHRPLAEIRLARLGNEAGLVGAADLARTR